MSTERILIHGSTAQRLAVTPAQGQIGSDDTLKQVALGDGSTPGGILMAREDKKNIGSLGYASAVKTDDYTVVAADVGKILVANKATAITFTLTAPATLGANFVAIVKNEGAGALTIDPDSATIDDDSGLVLEVGQAATISCDGSNFRTVFKPTRTLVTTTPSILYGDATLTDSDLGKTFILSGTTNYSVTLPDAHPGNEGAMIYFEALLINSAPVANFVSIISASKIDNYGTGANQRVMWGRETAVLRSTGSTWRKIGGRSIPLTGRLSAATMTGLSGSGSPIAVNFTTHDTGTIDGLKPCYDAANQRIFAPRFAAYKLTASLNVAASSGLTYAQVYFSINGTTAFPASSSFGMKAPVTPNQVYGLKHADSLTVTAGNYFEVLFNSSAGAVDFSLANGFMTYEEIVEW